MHRFYLNPQMWNREQGGTVDMKELCIWRASYKLYGDFQLHGESAPLIHMLFKGQLYIGLFMHRYHTV